MIRSGMSELIVGDISTEENNVQEVLPTHQLDGYKKCKKRDTTGPGTALLVWKFFRRQNKGGDYLPCCLVESFTRRKEY